MLNSLGDIFGITDGESRITGLIDSVDACEYLFCNGFFCIHRSQLKHDIIAFVDLSEKMTTSRKYRLESQRQGFLTVCADCRKAS